MDGLTILIEEMAKMNKDKISCNKCKHCMVVIVPDGAAMFCPYHGIVNYSLKDCKDYDPEEEGNKK